MPNAEASENSDAGTSREEPQRPVRTLDFQRDEPWPEPIETAEILSLVARRSGNMSSWNLLAYTAVTLYVAMTYIVRTLPICPLLILSSPARRSGKTTLLGVLSRLCYRSLSTNNDRRRSCIGR